MGSSNILWLILYSMLDVYVTVREIINNNVFAPVVECELSECNWLLLLFV